MTCEPIPMTIAGKAVTGIICMRDKRWPKCSVCGKKDSAVRMCDAPVLRPGKKKWGTCDAPLCVDCTVAIGTEEDLCPTCAEDSALVAIMVADQLRRLR